MTMKNKYLLKLLSLSLLPILTISIPAVFLASCSSSCDSNNKNYIETDKIINKIYSDLDKNFSINYINHIVNNSIEYIKNLLNINIVNCECKLFVDSNNNLMISMNIFIEDELQPRVFNLDLAKYNINVSNKDFNFNLTPYISNIINNVLRPDDILNTAKKNIASILNLNEENFDLKLYPVINGDWKTKLPSGFHCEQLYNLILTLKNKFIIVNNNLVNDFYYCANLQTKIGFPVVDERDYLDINSFWLDNFLGLDWHDLWDISDRWGYAYFNDWFSKLSFANFDVSLDNLYCSTEIQALSLYLNDWGDFWNYPLHQGLEPEDKIVNMQGQICNGQNKKIRGKDYMLISQALQKAVCPQNVIVYHGVEFMEDEFYDQLKDYIKYDELNNNYDYSECVGKIIQTNGFISTTFYKNHAMDFVEGEDWVNGGYHLPLKTPSMFKIKIPKGSIGCAYVSNFKCSNNSKNDEQQILIDRLTQFKIDNVYYENNSQGIKTTIFEIQVL